MTAAATPHFPSPAPIEAYGNGGFRFANMSHRGALLCLPDGIWSWPVHSLADINQAALAPVLALAGRLDVFLLGYGTQPMPVAPALRDAFHTARISFDPMTTAAAVRTWNILLAEGRRAGAGLIAVD